MACCLLAPIRFGTREPREWLASCLCDTRVLVLFLLQGNEPREPEGLRVGELLSTSLSI